MLRRNFIRTAVAALLSQFIKISLIELEPEAYAEYGFGFFVSREMLEDDLYGIANGLANAFSNRYITDLDAWYLVTNGEQGGDRTEA